MNPKTSIPDIQILSIHAYLKLYQNVVLPDIILLMKNIFNFRNLGIYSLIYTIVTLAVSIFKLTNGINYDPLGYWHEIDRAFVLFIIFVAVLTIKYFRFSKYIVNILSQFLPLILSILAYLFLLYLRGIVSPDIFKKLLFYSLVFFIAFFLLKWLFNTIFNLIDSLSRSKALNRMRIELWGLLIIILLLIPFGIYFFFKEDSSFIVNYCNSYLSYLTGVLLIILLLGVLFTARKKNKTGAAEIIMIVIYYFFFILFYLNIINIYVILAIELFGLLSIVLYSVRNSISFNTALALLIYLLMILRALYYFTDFLIL